MGGAIDEQVRYGGTRALDGVGFRRHLPPPALDRFLADARRRRFEILAITKLDRLARKVRHLSALAAELEGLGIDLVVLDRALTRARPAGRLLFNVLGAIAWRRTATPSGRRLAARHAASTLTLRPLLVTIPPWARPSS